MTKSMQYFWYVIGSISILAVAIGTCVYFFYVPFYFPKPTGAYAVGTHQYHWIDTTREKKHAQDPNHPYRELMVRAWYPAMLSPTDKKIAPYAPVLMDFLRQQNKTVIEKTVAFFSGLYRPIYAYCLPEASLLKSEKGFPVIIFCHGFACSDDLYTVYCSELASHGYVIFSINHTYDSNVAVFPDGRRVLSDPSAVGKLSDESRHTFFSKNIETWIADVRYVLTAIEHEVQQESSLFYKKLDIEHVGIFGHSFGGATTIQSCRRDKRFIAGCSLDGLLYGEHSDQPFATPFIFMRAERPELGVFVMNEQEKKQWQEVVKVFTLDINQLAKGMFNDAYIVDFANAEHMTFSDYVILKHAGFFPKKVDYDTGLINGFTMTARVNTFLVAFFDRYVKNISTDVLDTYRVK